MVRPSVILLLIVIAERNVKLVESRLSQIADIGTRIELVPLDPHFHDITIALYRQDPDGWPEFLIKSYSTKEGTPARIAFLVKAVKILGNMEVSPSNPGCLRFACGYPHQLACRRLFLEACKIEHGSTLSLRPLTIFDKKADKDLTVISEGDGLYRVSADDPEESMTLKRVAATAGGLLKLGEMEATEGRSDQVRFGCGHAHDELVGALLRRALNVRTAMREAEAAAARGVLSAPSAQDS